MVISRFEWDSFISKQTHEPLAGLRWSTLNYTHVVVGRTQFLTCAFLSAECPYDTVVGFPATWTACSTAGGLSHNKEGEKGRETLRCKQQSLYNFATSHQVWCILFHRKASQSSPHTKGGKIFTPSGEQYQETQGHIFKTTMLFRVVQTNKIHVS